MSKGEADAATSRGGGKRRKRRRSGGGALCGAIDLGTNNCRLLVARPTREGFKIVDAYSRIVRLGEGLAGSGRLSDAAMDRCIDALKICSEKLGRRNVPRIRAIATQACRSASNGPEFLERIRAETGLKFDLISPREEARLATLGCINLMDRSMELCLVVDIGGGSTELSFIDIAELNRREKDRRFPPPPIRGWSTTPLGVVTLAEQFPEEEEREPWFEKMKAAVKAELDQIEGVQHFRKVFEAGKAQIIGTSGTVTSIAGVHLELPFYERAKVDGLVMNASDARASVRRLLSQSPAERALEPCIGPERADLVLAGCAIFDAIMDEWPAERLRVADRGLREGVLFNLMGRHKARRRGRRRKRGKKNEAGS